MAMVVKNNMAAVSTLNTLNRNSGALQKSLAKVSSGMRINSAQDDASGYAISERMRVQIRALDQANQNTQNGSSLMKTAEGAVASTVEILKTLKEKAINAATDTNTDADRQTIQKEVNQFIDQIDDNALVTFNGKYLVEGSKTQSGNATKTAFTNQSLGLYEYTNSSTELTGATALTELTNRKGETLEITTSDKITASFVKDGHTYSTTFDVGDNTLEDIFKNLNTAYGEAIGDTNEVAFGGANMDTTLTIGADQVDSATNLANSLLNDTNTADDAVNAYAALAGGDNVIPSGYTLPSGSSLDADALKQALAVMAAYDSEGKTASSFSASAAQTNYDAQSGTIVANLTEALTDATSVTVSGTAYSDTGEAAKAIVTAMEKAADDYIKTFDDSTGGLTADRLYDAVKAAITGGVTYDKGTNTGVALVASDAGTDATGNYKTFAQAYLISAASKGYREDPDGDYETQLAAAKKTDSAWAKAAAKVEETDGPAVDTEYNAVQIAAAVASATNIVNSSDNQAIVTALATGDTATIEDADNADKLAAVTNALAVLSAYKSDGTAATGGAISVSYDSAKEGVSTALGSKFASANNANYATLTVDEDAKTVTIGTESDNTQDTGTDTWLAKTVSNITDTADYAAKGYTVSDGTSTADSVASAATLAYTKTKAGGSNLATDDTVAGAITALATAATNKAAAANSDVTDIEKTAALDYFLKKDESGGEEEDTGALTSGIELTSGDAAASTDDEETVSLVNRSSDIGLSASGKTVSTADGEIGFTVTANKDSLAGQISGLTISVANSEGQVKKTTNEFLNAFNTTIFAANESEDYSLKLHVGANANQSISVGLQDMRAEALGLKGSDGTVIDISTQERANAAIAAFDNAIAKALDQQTTIGAVEARLEYTASNLTTSAENTQAAESAIRDADMAKEMTNYTKNNVLLQAAQSMLAQANQNASAVLSLLQ